MDFKMHASKLHMRETSNTVRNGIHVQVVKKHGCLEQPLEQLNKITDPSCVSDGIVVFRIKWGKFVSKTVREKLKWH